MKMCLLLGLAVSGLLCGCAANTPYSERMIDTSTQTQQTVLPDAPPGPPLHAEIGPSN
ncbi:MAG TPA: hypothetical protein VH227_06725 [Candidatus Udaeobacter sp.]|jgi:hypothetical protein|nr:hypothetical protein [Candidatus Udaeobacter sp.]